MLYCIEFHNFLLEGKMRKLIGMMMLLMGGSAIALAGTVTTPEIDVATGASALTLLAGAVLVIRSRKKSRS